MYIDGVRVSSTATSGVELESGKRLGRPSAIAVTIMTVWSAVFAYRTIKAKRDAEENWPFALLVSTGGSIARARRRLADKIVARRAGISRDRAPRHEK